MTGSASLPRDDVVLAELGAIVGRLERELRLQVRTYLAEAHEAVAAIRQERAEARLELAQAAHDLASDVTARLAEVRDGKDGEPGPPGADSTVPGPPGENGRSYEPRGTWNAEASYTRLDVVALDGASFIALRDDPGICPGEGWQSLSLRGRAGQTGQRGEKGERGEAGPAAPVAASFTVTEDGVLTLSYEDGNTFSCDLYPLLARLR
jgi:hypothetical protein